MGAVFADGVTEAQRSASGGGPERALDGNDIAGLELAGEIAEELRDGEARARIAEIGGNFSKRDEDKGTFCEARVRDFEAVDVKDEVTVENEVEVEGAGPIGNGIGAVPTEFVLDIEEFGEELAWSEFGTEGDDGVEEARLRRVADGVVE